MAEKIDKKILIVEDDKDFLSILKMKFEREGFFVLTAEDGAGGIRIAGDERPDLIMSDVLMPRMDGIEMVRKIRKFDNKALIFFLTNMTDQASMGDMKEIGDFTYLIKSQLSLEEIVEKVKAKLGINTIAPAKEEIVVSENVGSVKIIPETSDKPEEVKIKTKPANSKIEISVFPIPKKK